MKKLAALLFLSGCTVIGHVKPPSDWPRLKVVEYHLPHNQMADVCYRYVEVPMWMRLMGANLEGCAVIFFEKNLCEIYVSADFPDQRVLEHEREHCEGKDHVGTTNLADAWAQWKASNAIR